ncbi:MAG: hypothetical protein AB7V16_12445 [Vulcanibacillus sp.]
MNVIFIILTGINLLVYIYAILVDLQYIQANKSFWTAFNKGIETGKSIEINYEKQKTKSSKGAFIFGTIIAIILLILLYGSIILVPIIIGLWTNVEYAIVSYLIILLSTTTIRLFNYAKIKDFNAKKMILMSLVGLFRFQLIMIILYGFKFNLDVIIHSIISSDFMFRNTLSVLLPILFFGSIILTVYLYWIAMKVNSKLNNGRNIKPKLSHFLIILVFSSFIGLLYIFELNIDTNDNPGFDRVVGLFSIIIASILIPALLNILGKHNNNFKVENTNGKVDKTDDESNS